MNVEEWIKEKTEKMSDRDAALFRRAVLTFEKNEYPADHPAFGGEPFFRPGARFDGVWNWDSAFHAVGLSNYRPQTAERQILGFLSLMRPDGMLPDNVRESGEVQIHSSKPPVFCRAALTVYRRCGDVDFLRLAYAPLCRALEFWETSRSDGTLFHYDAYSGEQKDRKKYTAWESGWDNSPRFDTRPWEIWPVDLCCFIVSEYRSLAQIAQVIGEDPAPFERRAAQIAQKIEELLWNDSLSAYTDRNGVSGEFSSVLTPASFMPLFVGIASEEHARAMARLAADPAVFAAVMPTVSLSDPAYSDDYWRGPVWLNTAYFAARGLKNYGFSVADEIRENVLALCAENPDGIYENYDLMTRRGLKAPDFSWSCVFLMEFLLNF